MAGGGGEGEGRRDSSVVRHSIRASSGSSLVVDDCIALVESTRRRVESTGSFGRHFARWRLGRFCRLILPASDALVCSIGDGVGVGGRRSGEMRMPSSCRGVPRHFVREGRDEPLQSSQS